LLEDRHGRSEQPPCRCYMSPHQGFPVCQQAVPRFTDAFGAEDTDARIITLCSAPSRFASRTLQQTSCQAPRRKRACRRRAKPIAARILPGDQGESEGIDVVDRTDRQAQRERDACAYRSAAQSALRSERELSGYGHECRRVAFAETLKDHPTELTFDWARGKRRGHLVECCSRRWSREPVERVDEAYFGSDLQALQKRLGIEPLERDRPAFVDDRARESRHALPPCRLTLLRGGQPVQHRQAFEPVPSGSTHPFGF